MCDPVHTWIWMALTVGPREHILAYEELVQTNPETEHRNVIERPLARLLNSSWWEAHSGHRGVKHIAPLFHSTLLQLDFASHPATLEEAVLISGSHLSSYFREPQSHKVPHTYFVFVQHFKECHG